MNDLKQWLIQVPKSELHVHLRGAMPHTVFLDLLNKFSVEKALSEIPDHLREIFGKYDNIREFMAKKSNDLVSIQQLFSFNNFYQFLATYHFTVFFFQSVEDFEILVNGVLEQLRAQNIVYAEITVSVSEYMLRGIELAEMIACLEQAKNSAKDLRVQWIIDLVRNNGPEFTYDLLKKIIALNNGTITGITLGGSEDQHYLPGPFAHVYQLAKQNGLRLSIHAGEALGAESVWDALKLLKAERIGHGVRAIEDPTLVEYLANEKIALEVCPTSNICTGIYSNYQEHPVKSLYEKGIAITINTDDPAFFATNLVEEYCHLSRMGFHRDQLLEMIKNGFRYAFLPEDEINDYLKLLSK